ncbi:MAG: hypothetical protein R3F13_16910 [Prosthecobacter sp.]
MNAHLHLDDDLAHYLNEQAKVEQSTLDVVLNRLLRRAIPAKPPAKVSLVKDECTGRMVLARDAKLPLITTEMVNDILNELP